MEVRPSKIDVIVRTLCSLKYSDLEWSNYLSGILGNSLVIQSYLAGHNVWFKSLKDKAGN